MMYRTGYIIMVFWHVVLDAGRVEIFTMMDFTLYYL